MIEAAVQAMQEAKGNLSICADGAIRSARPAPDNLYFSVKNLEAVYERAREPGCLSPDEVHGESAGQIVKRPWSERSFYARDPFENGPFVPL
jgi:hypothetical protein